MHRRSSFPAVGVGLSLFRQVSAVALLVGLSQTACTTTVVPPEDDIPPPPAPGGSVDDDGPSPVDPPPPGPGQCDAVINTPNEADYNQDLFRNQVVGNITSQQCAGCHDVNSGSNRVQYSVWANAAQDDCDRVKQFNELISKRLVDLSVEPTESRLYSILTSPARGHPVQLAETDPAAISILQFIDEAVRNYRLRTGNNNVEQPVEANALDFQLYSSTINGYLDNSGCSAAGCHGGAGVGGYALVADAILGSPEMEANFNATLPFVNLNDANASRVLVNSRGNHYTALPLSPDEDTIMLGWIEDAAVPGGGDGPAQPLGCLDTNLFDLNVFAGEIQPLLFGDVDFNDPGGVNQNQGCALQACHGNENRGGGALILSRNRSALENLQSFSCFVDQANAGNSQILLCPTDSAGCVINHPGEDILANAGDENYAKLFNYIIASSGARTPLSFGFFAENINVLYSDISIAENGQLQTCDNQVCHGIAGPGQSPQSLTNFGLIANSGGNLISTQFNFNASSGFANFINPDAASLFLYPTNEIANLDNQFATGLVHPGGQYFAANSVSAQTILRWAGGLRAETVVADGSAAVIDMNILGDFGAQDLDDEPLRNEQDVFFGFEEFFGANDNGGRTQIASGVPGQAEIDLDAIVGVAANPRIVYATVYITNISSNILQNARIQVTSTAETRVYVGNRIAGEADAGQTTTAFFNVSPFTEGAPPERIMVKMFQDNAIVENLLLSATLEDENGQPLDANDGRVVLKLVRE